MPDTLPSHASVVVIGGGVMGCSTLYHLAKMGVSDAILIERNALTSGTTWHSAAQVRALRNSRTRLPRSSGSASSEAPPDRARRIRDLGSVWDMRGHRSSTAALL